MVDITIINGGYFMVYKPTNISGGAHPVVCMEKGMACENLTSFTGPYLLLTGEKQVAGKNMSKSEIFGHAPFIR